MKIFGIITGTLAVAVPIVLCLWWVTMLLWSVIAAGIFGAPELTYWQTAGLCILLGLLTSGFRAARG